MIQRTYIRTNTQADNKMLVDAVTRAINRRSLNHMVIVEPKSGSPSEFEAWLETNVRRDWRISGDFVGFEHQTDAAAFRLVFG